MIKGQARDFFSLDFIFGVYKVIIYTMLSLRTV
jgi:hypothetical protein